MNAKLIAQFGKEWREVKRLEDELEEAKRAMKKTETKVVTEMINDGIDSVNVEGRPFWLKRAVHSSIPAEYRDDVQAWLKANDDTSALVKDYVQPSTFSAWIRESFDPDQTCGQEEILAKLPEPLRGKVKVAEIFTIGTRS